MVHRSMVLVLLWCVAGFIHAAWTQPESGGASQRAARPEQDPRGDLVSLVYAGGDPEQFGTREIGSYVMRKVQFVNTRGVPVRVEIVGKSCGCLGAAFDPTTIQPGQKCTLTLGASVSPSAGEQVHFASFRANWEDASGAHDEKGICFLRFTPAISFVVRPETAAAGGIRGAAINLDVSIRSLEGDDLSDALPPGSVELEGWSVTRLTPTDGTRASVVTYRVNGPLSALGTQDLVIRWQAADGLPAAALPLRIACVPEHRVFPGGVVFAVRPSQEESPSADLRIFSVPGAPRVDRVRVTLGAEWVDARITESGGIRVWLKPSEGRPAAGEAYAELLAEDGRPLTGCPIVWWSLDQSASQ